MQKRLTPDKKTLISSVWNLSFPTSTTHAMKKQLGQVKVDIIAYQDEVGCIREPLSSS